MVYESVVVQKLEFTAEHSLWKQMMPRVGGVYKMPLFLKFLVIVL